MKKQTKQTKLSLDKFKIAKIDAHNTQNILGGQTTTRSGDERANKSTSVYDSYSHCINDEGLQY